MFLILLAFTYIKALAGRPHHKNIRNSETPVTVSMVFIKYRGDSNVPVLTNTVCKNVFIPQNGFLHSLECGNR